MKFYKTIIGDDLLYSDILGMEIKLPVENTCQMKWHVAINFRVSVICMLI